jgi:transcriptional regulator with XRE-family HTH domain
MAEMSPEKRALLDMFGARVKAIRQDRMKVTQQELADLMHAPRTWVSDLENGGQRGIAFETVARFAKALEVSADYLLGLTDDPTPALRRAARAPRKAKTEEHTNTAALALLEQWYATPEDTPPAYWDELEAAIEAHPLQFGDEDSDD